jgi:hypothetical protein
MAGLWIRTTVIANVLPPSLSFALIHIARVGDGLLPVAARVMNMKGYGI